MTDRCSICKSKSHGTQAHQAADRVSDKRAAQPSEPPARSGPNWWVGKSGQFNMVTVSADELPAGAGPRTYAIVWIVEQNGRVHSCHATREHAEKEKGTNLVMPIAPWAILGSETARAMPVETGALRDAICQALAAQHLHIDTRELSIVMDVIGRATPVSTAPPRKGDKVLVEATYAGHLPEKPEVYYVRYGHEGLPSMVAAELVHPIAPVSTEEGRAHAKELAKWLTMALSVMNRNVYDGAMNALKAYHQWEYRQRALAPAVAETRAQEGRVDGK